MASLEELIYNCEKAKRQIVLFSKTDTRSYDKDLFPRMLKEFLINIIHCMKLTPSIPNGDRFNNWWRLLWDRCTIHPDIQNFAKEQLLQFVITNVRQETVTWKLKYLTVTVVHFTKLNISDACQYLRALISLMTKALQYPEQQTYYQAVLKFFDVHGLTSYDHLLNAIKQKLGDISGIIDPMLHLTDVDLYSRTVLNHLNRQSKSLVIYSIQCADANLIYKKLLSPLKDGKLWIDFNLKAETITIICQRSCLRSERPSTDSEEFDDCTSEVLTIDFAHIDKVTAKIWVHMQNVRGTLLSFVLNKAPNYMYDSSCTAVEQANKLHLNIEEGDELNRLLELLRDKFTTRFQILRNKPERKASQQNTSQSGESAMLLSPYPRRSVPVSSTMSLDSNLEMDTSPQVSVAHKEMLSLTRSGSTIQSICQIQTTIHTYVNADNNWPASTSGISSNQIPNKSRLSLTTNNEDEDDSVIESSQENKPSTITSLQGRIDRAMCKYNPKPYNPQVPTTPLAGMYRQRDDSPSSKENRPVSNTSQHHPSPANNKTAVMKKPMPKLLLIQPKIRTDMISHHQPSHSRSEQLVPANKSGGNGPTHVNDRLKDILIDTDDDNESVLSNTSDKSMILAGGLLNRSNIGRSLLKSSTISQDSQDSVQSVPTKLTPDRDSNTVPAKREVLTSLGQPSPEYHPKNVAAWKKIRTQKTPMGLWEKSPGSTGFSTDFLRRAAKRINLNRNTESISQSRKPKLDKSLNLLPKDSSGERFERHGANDTAESILDSAPGNRILPKQLTPTIQNNSVNEPASPSSSQYDVLMSSQTSRIPELPVSKLTNEIRDTLRSARYDLPETPICTSPTSELSFKCRRSSVSVPASSCEDTQVDAVRSGVDQSGDTNVIINTPVTVTVQPTVRRKKGRQGSDWDTTVRSSKSPKSSKRRQIKRKNKCDCDVNDTAELLTTKETAENAEHIPRRISTRCTRPPIRYTDELNRTYLESLNGLIRREGEDGYLTDTIVYKKRASRRPKNSDITVPGLSQTFDATSPDFTYFTDGESRGIQSDVEGGRNKKKKTKKTKHIHTEYDSSVIDMDENIRLRLSRRNSTCQLLTQDTFTQEETPQLSGTENTSGWGQIIDQIQVPHKNKAEPVEAPEEDNCQTCPKCKGLQALIKSYKKTVEATHDCFCQEPKEAIQRMYDTAKQIQTKIRETFGAFLRDE